MSPQSGGRLAKLRRLPYTPLAMGLALVWAMVNLVDLAASLIILANHAGYTQSTLTVTNVAYRDYGDGSVFWGLEGQLPEGPARLYEPRLADRRKPDLSGLQRLFPYGSRLEVLVNPRVTDTLFQGRTLRVVPYTPNLAGVELRRVLWWLIWCASPVAALIYAHRRRRASPAPASAAAAAR